jgi:hypothetical protein
MNRSLKSFLKAAAVVAIVAPLAASAAPFTAGNIAVFRSANNANNTTGSILELGATTASQSTPVQTIAIPNGASVGNGLRFSGSATSTGYLSSTADRSLITFSGVNTDNTASNVNVLNPRGVGTLDKDGLYALQTTYTATTTDNPQTRSATSLNNSNWFIADQSGIYTNSASAPDPAANVRGIKTFGGGVYVLRASGTAGTAVVATVSAPSGGSITNLPGLTNQSAAQDFYLVSSGSNGSAFDILYVSTSTTTAGIQKYSLVSGSWTANGTANVNSLGIFGLAAEWNGSGATLFGTTGNGATSANSLLRMVDSTGFNQTISLGSPTTLFTAAASTTLKGVEFVPVPEPSTLGLAGVGVALAGLVAWKRRQTFTAVQAV